jgi:tetratricopeptide (TPR) repeat protein
MTSKKTGRKQTTHSNPPRNTSQDTSPPALPFDRRLMERQLAAVGRILEERDFESIEEANAFLAQMASSGSVPSVSAETPLEKAQELVYQALEATGKRRLDLARQALATSPDAADAYVILAESATTPADARVYYEQGVQAGERALGKQIFEDGAGEFWAIFETRPYMRARQGLAQALWALGERSEAVEHAKEMLRLNPNDNQGVRYLLVNWLMIVNDSLALEQLLAQYPEEWSASWAYTALLHTFCSSGPGAKAERALKHALDVNPHVPLFLLGLKPPPKRLPEYYGMGDESEAITYLAEAAETWATTPEALAWMAQAMIRIASGVGSRGRGSRPSSRGRGPKRPQRT